MGDDTAALILTPAVENADLQEGLAEALNLLVETADDTAAAFSRTSVKG